MKERWKPVVGFDDRYEVSNCGRVRAVFSRGGVVKRVLKPWLRSGYPSVILCRNGRVKNFHIHRLVLAAFVGPRPKGFHSSHKDGNRTNNHASNLLYETPSDNFRRAVEHGTMPRGERNRLSKLTESEVRAIRRDYVKKYEWRGNTFRSNAVKLAQKHGISYSHIFRILYRSSYWSHIPGKRIKFSEEGK